MQDVQTPRKWMMGRLFSLILSKVLSPLATFLIIILVARILGSINLGRYNTVLAWYAIFQFISIFGMSEYISREVGKDNAEASKYLFHGLLFGLISSVICICLMTGSAILLNYPKELRYSIMIAGLALPFGAWTLMCQSIFTALQRIGYIALTSLVESILVLSLSVYCIYKQYGIIAIMCSLVVGKALASLFTLFLVHYRITSLRYVIDTVFLKKSLRPVFAFGLTGVAFQVFMRTGIIMLSKMVSMDTVGLYSSASKLTDICLMLPLAFYILMLPIIARDYKESPNTAHQKLERYTGELFVVVFFVFGIGMIFAEEILLLVYGEIFLPAVWPLRILLVAYLMQCADMILGMFCQAADHHKFAMITAIVRAMVNIGLSFIFISIWPMAGAAVATLISITLSFIIFQRFVTKKLYSFDWRGIISKSGLVCLIITILMFCIMDSMNFLMQIFSYSIGYGVLLLVIHRMAAIKARYAN